MFYISGYYFIVPRAAEIGPSFLFLFNILESELLGTRAGMPFPHVL